MKTYSQIREELSTGDIVLFSGKGVVSEAIKLFTLSKWSHIGMVVKIADWDSVLLWESTTLSNMQDAIDGKAKRGVQTVLLSERIRGYRGEIAIRKLNFEITPEMRKALVDFRKEVKNRPYEEDKIELIKAAYDGPFGSNRKNLSSLFCSELVAESYQRMGLLLLESEGGKPSNEYTPKDFSDKGKLDLQLEAKLEGEVLVVY